MVSHVYGWHAFILKRLLCNTLTSNDINGYRLEQLQTGSALELHVVEGTEHRSHIRLLQSGRIGHRDAHLRRNGPELVKHRLRWGVLRSLPLIWRGLWGRGVLV